MFFFFGENVVETPITISGTESNFVQVIKGLDSQIEGLLSI